MEYAPFLQCAGADRVYSTLASLCWADCISGRARSCGYKLKTGSVIAVPDAGRHQRSATFVPEYRTAHGCHVRGLLSIAAVHDRQAPMQ